MSNNTRRDNFVPTSKKHTRKKQESRKEPLPDDRRPEDPSPEQIEALAAEIRKKWYA